MVENNFLLVDLNEPKTKKLAETITSDTSRHILNYLTEKEGTESVIAEKLKIPLPTAHYHLQKLLEAGLVVVEEFHYSQKGREVNHYKLANKYIIIAPKKVSGLSEKLKGILPVAGVVLLVSALLGLFTSKSGAFSSGIESKMVPMMQQNVIMKVPVSDPNYVLWFLAGGLFTLLIYLVMVVVQEKMMRR